MLGNALVSKLNLEKHVDSIIEILINKLIKMKQLTPIPETEKYRHPFSMKGRLKRNFREDDSIYGKNTPLKITIFMEGK